MKERIFIFLAILIAPALLKAGFIVEETDAVASAYSGIGDETDGGTVTGDGSVPGIGSHARVSNFGITAEAHAGLTYGRTQDIRDRIGGAGNFSSSIQFPRTGGGSIYWGWSEGYFYRTFRVQQPTFVILEAEANVGWRGHQLFWPVNREYNDFVGFVSLDSQVRKSPFTEVITCHASAFDGVLQEQKTEVLLLDPQLIYRIRINGSSLILRDFRKAFFDGDEGHLESNFSNAGMELRIL